ncbi:MAG: hypothetical protein H6983_08420 [Ectothiorhodospiraceae bacterium]|nr:hypothetical protein [Ectothiorhodospiraceae bacterium]
MVTARRVLIANELGDGIGYSMRCLDLARSLRDAGHRPVVALRNLDVANRLVDSPDIPLVQGPYVVGRLTPAARRTGFRPTSFADLMACNGFGSDDHLYSMLRPWRSLVDLVRPDLVVGTYCPLLATAVHGRIPLLLLGSGYSTPPADASVFPAFRPDRQPYADQGALLETIRRVQARLGAPLPNVLTDVYRGDDRFVLSFPELDPYRGCRVEACVGHFEPLAPPQQTRGGRIYVYLAGGDPVPRRIVEALAAAGLRGCAYVRGAGDAAWSETGHAGIRMLVEPPPLEATVREASVVVHHGGLATAQVAMAAGRPQVVIPRYVDQILVAEAMAGLPFVRIAPARGGPRAVVEAVSSLVVSREAADTAMVHAQSVRARGLHDARRLILQACLDRLA